MTTTINPMTDDPIIRAGLRKIKQKPKGELAKKEKTERPRVWAIDFDGTLCDNRWPKIGAPNTALIECLKFAQSQGIKLILWTCREGAMLNEAVEWCSEQGITFDAVNENLPDLINSWGMDARKIGADVYIDDRALKCVKGEDNYLCELLQKM